MRHLSHHLNTLQARSHGCFIRWTYGPCRDSIWKTSFRSSEPYLQGTLFRMRTMLNSEGDRVLFGPNTCISPTHRSQTFRHFQRRKLKKKEVLPRSGRCFSSEFGVSNPMRSRGSPRLRSTNTTPSGLITHRRLLGKLRRLPKISRRIGTKS